MEALGGMEPTDDVSYQIYCFNEEGSLEQDGTQLDAICRECLASALDLSTAYVWQHDRFNLEVTAGDRPEAPRHLHGSVRYGDNVEAEWLVVALLLDLTRRFPCLAARVQDSDGEFLLIETSAALPKWVTPESADNRVYLYRGELHLLPLSLQDTSSAREAVEFLVRCEDSSTAAPAGMRRLLTQRLQGMPASALTSGMHQARCQVPRKVAYLLHHEPQLIASAVDTFYNRLPADLKAASKMTTFPPEDFVTVLVSFNRCQYAQLIQQQFEAPKIFPMVAHAHPDRGARVRGMKLACAFEMMCASGEREPCSAAAATSGHCGDATSNELTALDCNDDATWLAFKARLLRTGLCRGHAEGEPAYQALLQAASQRYCATCAYVRANAALSNPSHRCRALLEGVEINEHTFVNPGVGPELGEDERWLEEGETILQRELQRREAELAMMDEDDVGDAEQDEPETHENPDIEEYGRQLQGVVKGMHGMLAEESSYHGIEIGAKNIEGAPCRTEASAEGDDDSSEDDTASFDGDTFMHHLTHSLGLTDGFGTSSVSSDVLLRGTPPHDETLPHPDGGDGDHNEAFTAQYSEALDRQLKELSLGASGFTAREGEGDQGETEQQLGEDADDLDVNLVQNLLASYSAQGGLPGPISNLLGIMGMSLPDSQ